MRRYLHVLGVCLAFLLAGLNVWSEETSPPSVLYVASERHTSLALNYVYFPQFARLGFGTPDAPWHPWFGTRELLTLLYLPGYERGQAFEVSPRTVIGSRFAGKVWESGFEALRQFDADQNGVVEADELNDLYVWRDADSSGTFEAVVRTGRKDEIIACRERFAGFDLRTAAVRKSGYAREGLLAPFAVFRSHRSRIHLLEFAIRGSFTDRFRGYLSYAGTQQVDPDHRFSGEWCWEMNAQRGRLLLAASGREIRGIVQHEGRHADIINLPLEVVVTDGQAEWQSVSPLGLTRSVVRLSQEFGQPVLHGQAWSTRNGKLQKGSWKAYYAKPLE